MADGKVPQRGLEPDEAFVDQGKGLVLERLEQLRKATKSETRKWEDLAEELRGIKQQLAARITDTDQKVEILKERLQRLDMELDAARNLTVLSPEEFSYFRFEDLHRGDAQQVCESLKPYLTHFARCQRVADLGCGRGEFLDLCKSSGIGAYGVDSNEDMTLHCERLGLNIVSSDILEHLRSLPDKWLDGIFCSQVIEHLSMSKVRALLAESVRVLKAGTRIVLVTINPLSLFALANNFYLDPTHVRPLPPETVRFLAEEAGFRNLEVDYFSPFGPEFSLLPISVEEEEDWQKAVRVNFERLNHVVFGYQEYALVGLK